MRPISDCSSRFPYISIGWKLCDCLSSCKWNNNYYYYMFVRWLILRALVIDEIRHNRKYMTRYAELLLIREYMNWKTMAWAFVDSHMDRDGKLVDWQNNRKSNCEKHFIPFDKNFSLLCFFLTSILLVQY